MNAIPVCPILLSSALNAHMYTLNVYMYYMESVRVYALTACTGI